LDENERSELMGEVKQEEASEEILEEFSEEAAQPIEAQPAEDVFCEHAEECTEELPAPAAQPTKIGAGAVLALLCACLLTLAALVPAWQYTKLAIPAVRGVAMERVRRCYSAAEAYNELLYLEQEVAAWGAENFSFGDLPAFATGDFAIERFVPLINELDGLRSAYEAAFEYLPEGPRRPLRVRRLLERIKSLDDMYESIDANLDPAAKETDATGRPALDQLARAQFLLEATQAARAQDKAAQDRALLYDAIELNFAVSIDVSSKDVGRRLAALKKAAGSEPWMYEQAELMRAREADDFPALAGAFARRFARNRDDVVSLTGQAKALHLDGQRAKAERIIKKYSRGQTEGYMQALRAELLIREGNYQEAIDVCDKVIAKGVAMTEDMATPKANGGGIMEAVAQKGAALLFLGKAQEAHALLGGAMDAPFGEPGQGFMGAALAAAVLAEDGEAAQMLAMTMQQYGYSLSPEIFKIETEMIEQELEALKEEYLEEGMELEEFLVKHEITLEEFFELTAQPKTEVTLNSTLEEIYKGWGGFGA